VFSNLVLIQKVPGSKPGQKTWASDIVTLVFYSKVQVQVKVKVSLGFNWAPCHDSVLGSGGIPLRILDLGNRCMWVVTLTPRPLYPRERAPSTHCIGGRVGPRAGLDSGEKKNSHPLPGLEPPIIQPVAQSCTTELSRLLPFPGIYLDSTQHRPQQINDASLPTQYST
jgi:hypothetical protein